MTTEELLKPRYKVIADYPDNKNEVGDIITIQTAQTKEAEKLVCGWYDKYPAIFESLPWWKGRKVEDMPRFVKHLKGGVFKVKEHCVTGCKIEGGYWSVYDNLLPATEADYNAYLKELEEKGRDQPHPYL